jgi:hypothetical protein
MKDTIINFVQNSPEEVNSQVAVFIAGMQAQKKLMHYRRKTIGYQSMANGDYFTDMKTGLPGK